MAPKRTTRSTPVTPTPNATPTTTVTEAQLQALIDQGVAAAMAEAEASRVRNGYNSNGSGPRPAQTARECSYSEFLKCKPLDFKGTEGVVGLTRWFEKIESVFSISNCTAASQVKFATCTLQDDALTWWNAHVKTTTPEAAHAMPWATLKKMMTDKYCPRGEIKKIETEMMFPEEIDKIEKYIGGLPNMIHGSVKASKPKTTQEAIEFTTELMDEKTHAYAERQAERCNKCKRVGHLTRDCRSRPANANNNNNNNNNNNRNNNNNNQKGNGCYECGAQGHFRRNFPKLRNNDRGNQAGNDRAPAKETMTTVNQGMSVEEIERVVAQRVANAIEAIAIYETKTNMARESISQTEQQECKVAENANNKRKWEGNYNGQCTVKGKNCKKVGHMTRECRSPTAARNQRTHTCYEYGSLGYFKSKCPIVKFQKRVDKKINTLSERQAENKRKLNNTSKNNQNQQQPNKRQNTGKAYTAGHREKKYYDGSKPLCPKCNYHHDGPCPPKCNRCNIVGHMVRNCRRPTNDNTANKAFQGTSQ
ncbi:putative reverse transcriptase domain-containing protein [Tanacetum coccineum]